MHTIHRTQLERIDAITFEQHLQKTIGSIVNFETYSLLFPRHEQGARFAYDESEQRVHLPVLDGEGRVLAVFVARGVDRATAGGLEPLWGNIGGLIGQNLLYYKRSLCDPATGLYTRHYLINCLDRALQIFNQESALPPMPLQDSGKDPAPAKEGGAGEPVPLLPGVGAFMGRGAIGIIVLRFAALRDVVKEYGYLFADSLMVSLADAMTKHCPEQVIAARTGDFEFALAVPGATKTSCSSLAAELTGVLGGVGLEHPLRRDHVSTSVSAGYVLYPQDAGGAFALKPSQDQARILLRKARLAAALANEQFMDWNARQAVMGFGNILTEGGRIVEVLPLSGVIVSLGSASHAREGQRFSVWTMSHGSRAAKAAPLYKGEIALMDVHENHAYAEILHLGDPAWGMAPGDKLVLLPEEQGATRQSTGRHETGVEEAEGALRLDPVTGLLRYGDFLAQWAVRREEAKTYLLALVRLEPHDELGMNPTDTSMGNVAELVRDKFGGEVLGGRYGINSLIVYHPDAVPGEVQKLYAQIADEVQTRLSMSVSAGIAQYPYLEFRRADMLENCRKALEYAQLLPPPHVGIFDSLALNISADKRFSQGDAFGAIKEYKLALLADERNILAWNSLGVSLANLGKHAEAQECFQKALQIEPDDIMAHYNLGTVYQLTGEPAAAASAFSACLERDGQFMFALLRLGQLAEQAGDIAGARSFYDRAATLPSGKELTHRHFARLALTEGNVPEAREHLHAALVHDPQDAVALQMMAGIYLDAGEDPGMAASLARQAVSLRPDLRAGWLELARAFDVMNRYDEARQARLRAGAL